jgi:hypothetical protein
MIKMVWCTERRSLMLLRIVFASAFLSIDRKMSCSFLDHSSQISFLLCFDSFKDCKLQIILINASLYKLIRDLIFFCKTLSRFVRRNTYLLTCARREDVFSQPILQKHQLRLMESDLSQTGLKANVWLFSVHVLIDVIKILFRHLLVF